MAVTLEVVSYCPICEAGIPNSNAKGRDALGVDAALAKHMADDHKRVFDPRSRIGYCDAGLEPSEPMDNRFHLCIGAH